MHTIVFVHGTGVREPAHTASFNLVQQALNTHLGAPSVRVEPCYWGGVCGSELRFGGVSIPGFETSSTDSGGEPDRSDYDLALWALLYDDAFAELDLLSLRPMGDELPPGTEPLGAQLEQQVRTLVCDMETDKSRTELSSRLLDEGLLKYFDSALADLVDHPSYVAAIRQATEPLTDYRQATARAVLALCIQKFHDSDLSQEGYLPLSAVSRDRIVELLIAALGGREAGALDWVKEKAGRLVKGIGTRWLRRRRGTLSRLSAGFAADIVLYQTRPQAVRDFLRDSVTKTTKAAQARGESGRVVIIGHSLGGIAAVDMLIEKPLDAVRCVITIGSQVPLLYELDALSSLPIARNIRGLILPLPHRLPECFPKWLNFYDLRDFLSFRAEAIFGTRVTDFEVDNGQPFPESHSAYWTNGKMWDTITNYLNSGD